MTDWSPEDDALLAAGRAERGPGAAAKERGRAAFLANVGAAAVTSSTAAAASATTAGAAAAGAAAAGPAAGAGLAASGAAGTVGGGASLGGGATVAAGKGLGAYAIKAVGILLVVGAAGGGYHEATSARVSVAPLTMGATEAPPAPLPSQQMPLGAGPPVTAPEPAREDPPAQTSAAAASSIAPSIAPAPARAERTPERGHAKPGALRPDAERSDALPQELPPAAVASAAPTEPAEAPSIEAEITALREVHRAVASGEPERALALLDRSPRDNGPLAEERAAARVVTLCQLGRRDEAKQAAEAFLRAHPASPLAARVRKACPEPAREPERGVMPPR
jgi:hypothetical protein